MTPRCRARADADREAGRAHRNPVRIGRARRRHPDFCPAHRAAPGIRGAPGTRVLTPTDNARTRQGLRRAHVGADARIGVGPAPRWRPTARGGSESGTAPRNKQRDTLAALASDPPPQARHRSAIVHRVDTPFDATRSITINALRAQPTKGSLRVSRANENAFCCTAAYSYPFCSQNNGRSGSSNASERAPSTQGVLRRRPTAPQLTSQLRRPSPALRPCALAPDRGHESWPRRPR